MTASCRDGSNRAPTASILRMPKRSKSWASRRAMARTPSIKAASSDVSASCCSAAAMERCRLSATVSISRAKSETAYWRASAAVRSARLRVFSQSANARSRRSRSEAFSPCNAAKSGAGSPCANAARSSVALSAMRAARSARFAVTIVDLLKFGIDNIGPALAAARVTAGLLGRLRGRFGDARGQLRRSLGRLANARDILARHRLLERGHGALDLTAQISRHAALCILESLLRRVDGYIRLITRLDQFATAFVIGSVGLGLAHQALDVGLGEPAGRLDANGLFLPARFVLGGDIHNPLGIDVECHFDLRHPARRRWTADKIELGQQLVVGRHLPLALEHADGDPGRI